MKLVKLYEDNNISRKPLYEDEFEVYDDEWDTDITPQEPEQQDTDNNQQSGRKRNKRSPYSRNVKNKVNKGVGTLERAINNGDRSDATVREYAENVMGYAGYYDGSSRPASLQDIEDLLVQLVKRFGAGPDRVPLINFMQNFNKRTGLSIKDDSVTEEFLRTVHNSIVGNYVSNSDDDLLYNKYIYTNNQSETDAVDKLSILLNVNDPNFVKAFGLTVKDKDKDGNIVERPIKVEDIIYVLKKYKTVDNLKSFINNSQTKDGSNYSRSGSPTLQAWLENNNKDTDLAHVKEFLSSLIKENMKEEKNKQNYLKAIESILVDAEGLEYILQMPVQSGAEQIDVYRKLLPRVRERVEVREGS